MQDEDAIAVRAQRDLSEILQLHSILESHGLRVQHHERGARHHQHGWYTLRGEGGRLCVIVNLVQQSYDSVGYIRNSKLKLIK